VIILEIIRSPSVHTLPCRSETPVPSPASVIHRHAKPSCHFPLAPLALTHLALPLEGHQSKAPICEIIVT
jgi:hypothetical protein